MKKHYKFAVAFFLSVSSLSANADGYRALQINLTDGSKVEVALSEQMTVSFTPTDLKVEGTTEDVSVPRDMIGSFEFTASQSAIKSVESDLVMMNGGELRFFGLPAGTHIHVYSLDGKLLSSHEAQGDWTLDIAGLPKGACIVTVNGMSYKFNIK